MNNTRQIYARIPGVNIWENDGTGAQVSIGLRGLNPNRSWEMNTRQNGYDISSDIFGYPEAYYNPSMEAVEKLKLSEVEQHYNLEHNSEVWSITCLSEQIKSFRLKLKILLERTIY